MPDSKKTATRKKLSEKVALLDQKIAALEKKKEEMLRQNIDFALKKIESMLIKARIAEQDMPAFLKKIETAINECKTKTF